MRLLVIILLGLLIFAKNGSMWNEILARLDASSWMVKTAAIAGFLMFISGVIGILLTRPNRAVAPPVDINAAGFPKFPNPYTPISVVGREFHNERVVLDGHAYIRCKFANVTFVYNGTTTLQFADNEINGELNVDTDNPAVQGTMIWLRAFGMLKDSVKERNPPQNVEPIRFTQRPSRPQNP